MHSRFPKINRLSKIIDSARFQQNTPISTFIQQKIPDKGNHFVKKDVTNTIRYTFPAIKQTRNMADNSNKLNLQVIEDSDGKAVLNFFLKNFWTDEPLNACVKLVESPETVEAISKYTVKNIGQNLSFLVKSETGELAGASMNSVKTKNDPIVDEITDPRFGRVVKLLEYVDKEVKMFEKFPDIDKYLSCDMISVDDKFKGRGIAKILMNKTRDLARKQGIKLMRVDCTSHFSAKASARLGMECIYELKYSDYIVDGVQVFKPDPPHNEIKVYVQRLD